MISVTRWFGEKRLRAIEHDQGSPLSYLRQMLRVSPAHFLTFIKIMPLARFRRALPPEAYHLARIVTARQEHGGTCLQMEIRLAQQAGVRLPLLHAVLGESPARCRRSWRKSISLPKRSRGEAVKRTIGAKPSCVATARWASSSWPKPSPSHACFPPSYVSWAVLLLVRHTTGRTAGRIADRQAPSPPSEDGLLPSHSDQDIRGRPNGGCSASDDRRIGLRVVLSQPSAPQTLSAVCKNRHRSSGCLRDSLSSSIAG